MKHLGSITDIDGAKIEPVETWKPVFGYEGGYDVSDQGRIRSFRKGFRGKILRMKSDKDGYLGVSLYKEKKPKCFRVHRLVAEAFIPNPDEKPVVHHKDENVQNNAVSNLEWVTNKENLYASDVFGKLAKTFGMPVNQYDLDGNLIAAFASVQDASRTTGIDVRNISARVRGIGNQTHGYKFKYAHSESEVMPNAASR